MNQKNISSSRKEIRGTFIIQKDSLKKIYKILEENIGTEISISAECKDGIDHDYSSLEDIFLYDNLNKSKIINLTFRASNPNSYGSSYFRIYTKRTFGDEINYDIQLPRDQIYSVKKSLDDVIESTFPWFRILSKVNFIVLYFLGFLLLVLMGFVFELLGMYDEYRSNKENSNSNETNELVFWAYILGALFFSITIEKFKKILFNESYFLIGKQIDRHAITEKFRWFALTSFLAFLGVLAKSMINIGI